MKVQEIVPDNDEFASKPLGKKSADGYLKNIFLTEDVNRLFCLYFDEKIYNKAKADCEVRKFHSLQNVYPIIGIAMATAYGMRGKLNSCYGKEGILDAFNLHTPRYTESFTLPIRDGLIKARMDIINVGNEKSDVEVYSISDEGVVEQAHKFQKKPDGCGRMVYSVAGNLSLRVRCIGNGTLNIYLRSMDIRNKEGTRLPVWIFYKEFKVNCDIIFDSVHPAWHDAPYKFHRKVKDGEILTLEVKWLSDAQTAIMKGNEVINEQRILISVLIKKIKRRVMRIRSGLSFRIRHTITYISKKTLRKD